MPRKPLKLLGLFASDRSWTTLSYAASLPRVIGRHPGFELALWNIAGNSLHERAALFFKLRTGRHDAVVLFHSVFSNSNYLSPRLAGQIAASRRPVAYFLGNEYKSMPEKMALARELRVALLITQISRAPVHELYRAALNCEVLFLPNAAFEPDEVPPPADRNVDIGYRAYDGPMYLGHDDRSRIAAIVEGPARARGLNVDISFDPAKRFDETGWRDFLRRCKAQLGTESGSDIFELTDATRISVNRYCESNPSATFEDIRRLLSPTDGSRVSGRTISSRHLEAAAARCVQILFDGEYGGIWRANEHYLSLDRDGRNVEDVLDALADPSLRARIADAAFDAAHRFSPSNMMAEFETAMRGICA